MVGFRFPSPLTASPFPASIMRTALDSDRRVNGVCFWVVVCFISGLIKSDYLWHVNIIFIIHQLLSLTFDSYLLYDFSMNRKLIKIFDESGLNDRELAKKIGCHFSLISHWRHNRCTPTIRYAIIIEKLFSDKINFKEIVIPGDIDGIEN